MNIEKKMNIEEDNNQEDVFLIDDSEDEWNEEQMDIEEQELLNGNVDMGYESADSACSVFSEENYEIREQNLNQDNVRDIVERQIVCRIIFCYLTDNDDKFCPECFVQISDQHPHVRVVRIHEINRHFRLQHGGICCDCGKALHQIYRCSMCPICTQ